MKSKRISNGYVLIYNPKHPSAYKDGNHKGYVYEHIYIMEKELGRTLGEHEHVHHLNGVRDCNLPYNLIVLTNSHHGRLHNWINRGAPFEGSKGENRVNSKEPKLRKCSAARCDNYLSPNQKRYCSTKCHRSISKCPEREALRLELDRLQWNFSAAGRHYGVSDNAVRKWCAKLNLSKATSSQAEGTPSEGVETTGVVEPT